MGCFIRTRKEWEDNFWNNDKEFPNDNSKTSNDRLLAFELAIQWLNANQ